MATRSTKSAQDVALPTWHRLGGETLVTSGSSVVATLPVNTEIIHIAAENGDIFYNFGALASAAAPGFVPQGGRVVEGPLRDLTALAIFGSGGSAHIQYYQENKGR